MDRQVWVMESMVERTLIGVRAPKAAMHAANAVEDVSLKFLLSCIECKKAKSEWRFHVTQWSHA